MLLILWIDLTWKASKNLEGLDGRFIPVWNDPPLQIHDLTPKILEPKTGLTHERLTFKPLSWIASNVYVQQIHDITRPSIIIFNE